MYRPMVIRSTARVSIRESTMEYELFISRASPYSSKVLALLGYAGFSHRVRVQNGWTRYAVIRRLTGETMVPMLRRGDWAINDSTDITRYVIDRAERPTLPGDRQVDGARAGAARRRLLSR